MHDMNLLNAAIDLRASAPLAWDRFLQALDGHASLYAAALVKADLTRLPISQGQAQSLRQLHATLLDAPALKEQAAKKPHK